MLFTGHINGVGIAAPINHVQHTAAPSFTWSSGAKSKSVENRGPLFPWVIEVRTHPVWGLVRWLIHPSGQEIGPFFTYDAAEGYARYKILAGV